MSTLRNIALCDGAATFALSILATSFLFLASSSASVAQVSLTPRSTAEPADTRSAERNEIHEALKKLLAGSKKFNDTLHLIRSRCKGPIRIYIQYGESGEHTHSEHDGGTFVPEWKSPDADPGQRVLIGGTLIINKARLIERRPQYAYTEFLYEIITHELFHAYEYCFDDPRYLVEDDNARRAGEEAAAQINPKTRTLGGTGPLMEPASTPAAPPPAAPPVQGAGLVPARGTAATMSEVTTLWASDRMDLAGLREDYRDASEFCDEEEFSQARDEYLSTLNGLLDAYSSLLVDASTTVRNELNAIIAQLSDEREAVLSGEACDPVEYVRICDVYGSGFYYIPGADTCLQIGGRVDFGSYFSPSVETGTLILGVGDEVALDKSDTRLEGYGAGIELGVGFGGWLHKFDFDYGQAEGDSSAEEPVGGRPVGITYFGMSTTTGINLGASGANIESEVDIEALEFGYEGLKGFPIHERLRFMYGFGASAEWFQSDHKSEFTTPSFIDIFSETDQSVTEDAFGIGPVIGASVDFGRGFSLYGSVGVRGIYSSAELDSVQRTTCVPCAPDPTLVEIETDEEEEDFTWGSKITVGFGYHPTPRLSLNLEGTASTGPRWEVDNPESPDEDPTHLDRQHGTDLTIGAGLRWAFGVPPPPPP